jgi:tRNA A37 methylthiotransferase MiaB
MPNQVPVHVARERNKILRELASEKKLAFMRSFLGKPLDAITLNVVSTDTAGAFTEALTDNYLKLRLRGRHAPNRWLRARVEGVVDGALVGREAISNPRIENSIAIPQAFRGNARRGRRTSEQRVSG